MSGLNGAKELKSRPKRAFFFLSIGDDMKIKRSQSFFSPPPVSLPFIVVLSRFLPFYMAWRQPKRVVKSM